MVTQASKDHKPRGGGSQTGTPLTSRASFSGWGAGAWGPWRLLFPRYVPIRTPPSLLSAWVDPRRLGPHISCPSLPRSPGAGSNCRYHLELPPGHPLVARAHPAAHLRLQPPRVYFDGYRGNPGTSLRGFPALCHRRSRPAPVGTPPCQPWLASSSAKASPSSAPAAPLPHPLQTAQLPYTPPRPPALDSLHGLGQVSVASIFPSTQCRI